MLPQPAPRRCLQGPVRLWQPRHGCRLGEQGSGGLPQQGCALLIVTGVSNGGDQGRDPIGHAAGLWHHAYPVNVATVVLGGALPRAERGLWCMQQRHLNCVCLLFFRAYGFVMAPVSAKDSFLLAPQALLHLPQEPEFVVLDQEQIEAPQFSESRQQTPRPETGELPTPRATVVMTPLTFGAAMMRMAHSGQQRRRW